MKKKTINVAMNGFMPVPLFHSNIQDDNENQNTIHINMVFDCFIHCFSQYEQGHTCQIGSYLAIY